MGRRGDRVNLHRGIYITFGHTAHALIQIDLYRPHIYMVPLKPVTIRVKSLDPKPLPYNATIASELDIKIKSNALSIIFVIQKNTLYTHI